MSAFDYAIVEVDGVRVDAWSEYRFSSDIFTPADAWTLTLGIGSSKSSELAENVEYLRRSLPIGGECKIYVAHGKNKALQHIGVVDRREIMGNSEGTSFRISGRDQAAYLVDNAVSPTVYENTAVFLRIAQELCAPFGIAVKADALSLRNILTGKASTASIGASLVNEAAKVAGVSPQKFSKKLLDAVESQAILIADAQSEANGGIATISPLASAKARHANGLSPLQVYQLKVTEAAAQAGETIWSFLDRHARRLGILMRMSPQGALVLYGLDYGQAPKYKLVRRIDQQTIGSGFASIALSENNVLSGGELYDVENAYSEVTVYGHGRSHLIDAARARVSATAVDTNSVVPYAKKQIIHDNSIKTADEAERRAKRELAKSLQSARTYQYTVRGHGMSGSIFATDTVCHVTDELVGIDEPLYITSREFTRDLLNGPMTTLQMFPLGAVAL